MKCLHKKLADSYSQPTDKRNLCMLVQDLVDELKGELSGDFEKVILGLMMPPADYDAFCVKEAVKGLGTDERALTEVLCSRTTEQMDAMKASYKKCKYIDELCLIIRRTSPPLLSLHHDS